MDRMLRTISAWCVLPVIAVALVAPVAAQAPAGQTASQFYLEYRKVFEKAKKIEELLPMMSAETRKMVESTPPADRVQMFEIVKMMGALTSVKITKEAKTDKGATLTVEALDSDKAKTTGTIEIVREGNAWKLGKESWTN